RSSDWSGYGIARGAIWTGGTAGRNSTNTLLKPMLPVRLQILWSAKAATDICISAAQLCLRSVLARCCQLGGIDALDHTVVEDHIAVHHNDRQSAVIMINDLLIRVVNADIDYPLLTVGKEVELIVHESAEVSTNFIDTFR